MKNNKKGFTLVEIIGVVAILGIVAVIGLVSVNSIIQKGKNEHYTTAEKHLKVTAESYAQANREYLPKNVGEMTKVKLRTLVDDNYMEPIKDYHDKNCDLDKSYVQIYKYSKTNYSYLAYLDCPDYKNAEENNNLKPVISIEMTPDTDNVKNTTAKINIKDSNKILSYSVTIYKYDEEIYTTGNIDTNYDVEINRTIDISKHTPGKLKTVVKATNIYGNTATAVETVTYKDKKAPKCIIKNEDTTRTNSDWITTNRKITVGCNDGEDGSGCEREEYTKTFKTDMKYGYITIKDKAGNETECRVDVFIDKTKPSCSINDSGTKGTNDWYITNATMTLIETDAMSGIKSRSLQKSATLGAYNGKSSDTQTEVNSQVWYGFVQDYAGNTANCVSKAVKVDTTAPTAPTGGSIVVSGSSKDAELGAVGNSYDATSGIKEYRYQVIKNSATWPANTSKNFTTSRAFTRACGTSYYGYAIAIDNAGNISAVHKIGSTSDGKDEYSAWGACDAKCNGGTQTRTNSCALVTSKLSQACNEMDCCSKTTAGNWTAWSTCTKTCGGGKTSRSRDLYSYYDGRYCSTESASDSCNTHTCCTESTSTGSWGTCECSLGNCSQTRTITYYKCNGDSQYTETSTESQSCSAPAHTHVYKARGTRLRSFSFSWNCTGGHVGHKTGYYIYCKICGQRPTSGATLVCPTNPYGPSSGWDLISD